MGSDAGPRGPELVVTGWTAEARLTGIAPSRGVFLVVGVAVTIPPDAVLPVPVAPPQFSLVLGDRTSLTAAVVSIPEGCPGDRRVEPGGRLGCRVAFDVAADMTLDAVRFFDPTTQLTVSAPTPDSSVPEPTVPGDAPLRELEPNQLTALCAFAPYPEPGAQQLCPAGMLGGRAVVGPEPGLQCGERRLPIGVQVDPDACLLLEADTCTVDAYLDCLDALRSDLCAAVDPGSPCGCASPILDPMAESCP